MPSITQIILPCVSNQASKSIPDVQKSIFRLTQPKLDCVAKQNILWFTQPMLPCVAKKACSDSPPAMLKCIATALKGFSRRQCKQDCRWKYQERTPSYHTIQIVSKMPPGQLARDHHTRKQWQKWCQGWNLCICKVTVIRHMIDHQAKIPLYSTCITCQGNWYLVMWLSYTGICLYMVITERFLSGNDVIHWGPEWQGREDKLYRHRVSNKEVLKYHKRIKLN